MSMAKRMLTLALFLTLALAASGAEPAKSPKPPLTEAQVLNLIEMQIDDSAIIDRIRQGGGPGPWVNDDILKKLKGAGASGAVLQVLRPVSTAEPPVPADDPARERLAVHVTPWSNRDSGLKSELRINGNLVGEFSSAASAPVGKFVKMGWNTVTLKTSVVPDVKYMNELAFRIGPISKKAQGEKEVMDLVVWEFVNTVDWDVKGGVLTHASKLGAKEVTLTFKLFFAGVGRENRKVAEGDYVLKHGQWSNRTPFITTTIFVNGAPLTTYLGNAGRQQVVITPFLTKGRNEIRMVADGVTNLLSENDVAFDVLGPAEYSPKQKQFLLNPVLKFHSHEGWEQDEKTGLWHAPGKPGVTRHERTFTFDLAEKPMAK